MQLVTTKCQILKKPQIFIVEERDINSCGVCKKGMIEIDILCRICGYANGEVRYRSLSCFMLLVRTDCLDLLFFG